MKVIVQHYRGERIDKIRVWKTITFFGIKIRLPKTKYVLIGSCYPLQANRLKDIKYWIDEIKDNVENL